MLGLDVEPDEDVGDGLEEEEGHDGEHGQEGEQVSEQKVSQIIFFPENFKIISDKNVHSVCNLVRSCIPIGPV